MKIYKKAILPSGFQANGVACGLKRSGKPDLALLFSQAPAKAACLFTTNRIQAAPIKVNRDNLRTSGHFRAILINSGNANCFTGPRGLKDARDSAAFLAGLVGAKKADILVASTGIIGKRLEVAKIKKAMPSVIKGLSKIKIGAAAKAILTTDNFTKEVTVRFNIGSKSVTICGIAKGAGMIAPNMATMLAFILTDAQVQQGALRLALRVAVENSFNCITVDGCMSTNDSVMMLANGCAGNAAIDTKKNFRIFLEALNMVCLELAQLIIRDAEGASKFIRIRVQSAKTPGEAKIVALSIANSNLFKTAVYGQNPNFGRIAAAVGASGVDVKEENLKIGVSSLEKKDITVEVSLGRGSSCATVYTSDLTPEYIKINAEYN
ncbi:MAG: bifunctional glutamate N-acetyltransferase/amino-acid acetyltransferase ArgJ [Candidatus Omnitrophica bacterium]|nr:bifunctional glutamate N-acetyltransferase/amino-acid acetyltransferase ArgJ [Candidatus Omnitrophota bacterium]